jgi:hypothetical protein
MVGCECIEYVVAGSQEDVALQLKGVGEGLTSPHPNTPR